MTNSIPSSMQAWQFSQATGGIDKHLALNKSAPLPPKANSLGQDQVLIKVITSALNPVDYKLAESSLLRRLVYGADATPGSDFAGRVVATGPNSGKVSKQDLKSGQLVFGKLDFPSKYGTLAEYTVATRAGCVSIPEGVKEDDAACVGIAGLTAYQSVVPFIRSGNRIFINGGSSGVGTFAIQFAKVLGCHVTVSCSGGNADLCKSLGADEVIDYRIKDVVTELQKGPKLDLVFDAVGTPAELYWQAHTYTKPEAVFTFIAGSPTLYSMYDIAARSFWPGFLGGGKRPFKFIGVASKADELTKIGEWMAEGKVKAVIDETFGLDDKGAPRAYQKLKTGRAKGKILVRMTD